MRCALGLLLVSSVGCAQNAILELTIPLPASGAVGGATRASIGFQSSEATDPSTLSPNVPDQRSFDLPPGGDAVQRLSVVAGDVESPLWLSVRYCDETCSATEPPTWIRYERPFYLGEFTEHELTLPLPGAPDVEVGTCEVFGCFPGGRPPNPCIYDEGTRHACDP